MIDIYWFNKTQFVILPDVSPLTPYILAFLAPKSRFRPRNSIGICGVQLI